jgi:hypothetical protein
VLRRGRVGAGRAVVALVVDLDGEDVGDAHRLVLGAVVVAIGSAVPDGPFWAVCLGRAGALR